VDNYYPDYRLSIRVNNQGTKRREGHTSNKTIQEQKLQLILIGISDKLELLSEHHPEAEREIGKIIDEFGVLSFQISGTDIKELYGKGSGGADQK